MKKMTLKSFLFLFLFGIFTVQSQDREVLFTVDSEPVYVDDFLRVYKKNLDLVKDENQKEIDQYLDLYINYALKIKEAKTMGYDTLPTYLREFNSYKKQLAKNYLTDRNVTDELVKEAYERISTDVWVSHILIRIPETETDTMAVVKQLMNLKEKLLNSKDIEELSRSLKNGNAVIAEDLGYFSGFKTVYPFETVAYNTPIGEVSDPFRTSFGFHILKVHDKRPSKGYATAGHIFISKEQKDSTIDPMVRINEIHSMLRQGKKFEDLAKQFSEDRSSAINGGKLKRFKSANLRSVVFEDKIFSLNKGEISEPFETEYGWHIAKLYNFEPIEPFDKKKLDLEKRVMNDSRSVQINKSFIRGLKQKYKVNDQIDLSYFVSILNEEYFKRNWSLPVDLPQDKPLLKVGDQQLNYFDFASFLENSQKRIREKQSFDGIVKSQFEAFLNQKIMNYHENNLENINPDYRNILNEYRNGLLLFDLMEDQIWNAVRSDSLGIESYYEKNRSKYNWPERVDAIVANLSDEKQLDQVRAVFETSQNIDSVKENLPQDLQEKLILNSGLYSKNDREIPSDLKFAPGIYTARKNGNLQLIKVLEVLEPTIKDLDECRGLVISDYQEQKEREWLVSLSNKYEVKVNNEVLERIKSKI